MSEQESTSETFQSTSVPEPSVTKPNLWRGRGRSRSRGRARGSFGEYRGSGMHGARSHHGYGSGEARHGSSGGRPQDVSNFNISELRNKNTQRFSSDSSVGQIANANWSSLRWNRRGKEANGSTLETRSSEKSVEKVRTGVIGTARATGLTRVPDAKLAKSPSLVISRLQDLRSRAHALEDDGRSLIPSGERITTAAVASDATIDEWECILAEYRQLTMAVTASSSDSMDHVALSVYESAADACLLGGNLGFYLSCQTRLLSALYVQHEESSPRNSRHSEFMSYSLLYFGVFSPSACELAQLMRAMPRSMISQPNMKFAFAAVEAVNIRDGFKFISLYRKGNVRQRTLMNPSLGAMRSKTLFQIAKAYLQLEKSVTLSFLGMETAEEFMDLLKEDRPELAQRNRGAESSYSFRVKNSG